MLKILYTFGIPCISVLVLYMIDRKRVDSLFKGLMLYGAFAVAIRVTLVFPVMYVMKAIKRAIPEFSWPYVLFALILSVVFPLMYALIAKYVRISIDEKK